MQTELQSNGTWLASYRTIHTGRLMLAEGDTEEEALASLKCLQFERWCQSGVSLYNYCDIFGVTEQ